MGGLPLAISLYLTSVAIHVTAVVIFLGITFLFFPLQVAAEKAPRHLPFVIRVIRDAERKLVWPGLVIIAATGIFQTIDFGWDRMANIVWLSASVTIFVFIVLVRFTVMRWAMDTTLAEVERAEAAAGDDGEIKLSPEFKQAANVLSTTGSLMGLLVIMIAFLMETKPF